MKCKKCGKKHESHDHFVIEKRLTDKGFPTHSKKYDSAHEEADKLEKKRFGPKAYQRLKKLDEKVSKHELIGKNLKSGKIEVSKRVPKNLIKEVAFHEAIENKILRKKK